MTLQTHARAMWMIGMGILAATLLTTGTGCQVTPSCVSKIAALPVIPDGVVSRAITWENRQGEPGQGGKERDGRKGSPAIPNLKGGQTATLMDIQGCGVIRHIWITLSDRSPEVLRSMVLRMYWDNSPVPSVEVPFGDFFGTAHGQSPELDSHYVSVPFGKGYNCYFAMPFASAAKITLENDMPADYSLKMLFFQIDYELHDRLPPGTGRFHAQFRRQNPTTIKDDFVILDTDEGPGMFIGCVMGIRPLGPDWWGEGEVKMYMDGDTTHPTICGTGTEDYYCAAWGMGLYQRPYHGCTLNMNAQQFPPHGLVSMYRWHPTDPVYYRKSLKATVQQIGYAREKGLFERSDDWCSVAYWYQQAPTHTMPPFPDRAARLADILPPAPTP